MYVKLPPGNLNLIPCPLCPTSIYTCGVTTVSRVRDGKNKRFLTVYEINHAHKLRPKLE